MNIYEGVPAAQTADFTIRLVRRADAADLAETYGDTAAVALMNDDNCDFGFYMPGVEQMEQTIDYWLDHYRQRNFVRFAVVSKSAGKTVGTLEGFGGDTGVLRIDINGAYENAASIRQLLDFATSTFRDYFGNARLVTKAAPGAAERRMALRDAGWQSIDSYRGYPHYYAISVSR